MIDKVLVPLDGSPLAEGILEPLSPLLGPRSRVTLVRVTAPGTPTDRDPTGPEAARALEALVDLQSALRARCPTEVQALRGDPAAEIVRHARETGQDLVAMATHGRGGLERAVRGSVAERVLRTSDTPLLLCNPRGLAGHRALPWRRILVAHDGSPEADRVLPLVVEVARACRARVSLLRVEPFVVTSMASPYAVGDTWDPADTVASLGPQVERLRTAGLEVEAIGASGAPATEILREAAEADLLALTTHGRSGPSRWWFGSVAEQVLREARCPLLVVRARSS